MKEIFRQTYSISKREREEQNGYKAIVLWFTGLSGSGKSTLANALEVSLFERGVRTYVLDGDNTRLGINKDLDFSDLGRKENIRRVAEVSKLMNEAGLVIICSFISPFREDRAAAKEIIGSENFFEIYVKCPLEVCEQRDVKGLYKKARTGAVPNFTGVSSPYEEPLVPDLIVNTNKNSLEICHSLILEYTHKQLVL
jgi:bifunctional enzyme CysN/CysC